MKRKTTLAAKMQKWNRDQLDAAQAIVEQPGNYPPIMVTLAERRLSGGACGAVEVADVVADTGDGRRNRSGSC